MVNYIKALFLNPITGLYNFHSHVIIRCYYQNNKFMKILLLQPPTVEKNVTSFMYPPIGLTAVAAYLQKENHEDKGFRTSLPSWPRQI